MGQFESYTDGYPECKVVLAPSGDLLTALPIYAGVFRLTSQDVSKFTWGDQVDRISVGAYQHIGYVVFHPQLGEMLFSVDGIKHFDDLGEL